MCCQQGIKQMGVKQGLDVHVIILYKLNHKHTVVPSSLFFKTNMFQPL
jgi:hypothetical protein